MGKECSDSQEDTGWRQISKEENQKQQLINSELAVQHKYTQTNAFQIHCYTSTLEHGAIN